MDKANQSNTSNKILEGKHTVSVEVLRLSGSPGFGGAEVSVRASEAVRLIPTPAAAIEVDDPLVAAGARGTNEVEVGRAVETHGTC